MTTALEEAPPVPAATPPDPGPLTGEMVGRVTAAARLDVSLATIDRYLREGRLGRHKNPITHRVLINGNDIEHVRAERNPSP